MSRYNSLDYIDFYQLNIHIWITALTFFNAWLSNARGDGTVDALYRYWMLGEIAHTRPPRWSIARHVLGWFE